MTGPEHYEMAEELLNRLDQATRDGAALGLPATIAILLRAHVHAQLADTAVNGLYEPDTGLGEVRYRQWNRVAG